MMTSARYLSFLGTLFIATIAPAGAQVSDLPDLGEQSAAIISIAEERELGENFMRSAHQQLRFIDDPELNGYIQALGQKFAKLSGSQQEFHFFIINDNSLNAFAVPGGFIGVHTGLILATQTEAELASVLAHETAHISQRHLPRMIARAKEKSSLPTIAALIAAAMLGGQAAEAAIVMTAAKSAKNQLDYTREFEREADRIGMQILAKAQYEPRAMSSFFQRLQTSSRTYDTGAPEFLRTHPVTSNRIAEARARADRYPKTFTQDSSAFHHFRARVRVLSSDDPAQAVNYFAGGFRTGKIADENAHRYGYSLALLKANRLSEASKQAALLLSRNPGKVDYQMLKAEIEMAMGRLNASIGLLARAHQSHPDNPVISQRYAAALLRGGQANKAKQLLRKVLRKHPGNPMLQKMLAAAAVDSGDPLTSHRALAEFYYLNGNARAAIEQLMIANRYTKGNFYDQSGVDARMQEIKGEIARYKDDKDDKKHKSH
ncbi:MAG TPA: M48 family peptidase [Acidiferrobacteraceae bacterium]|nr:M48 family peptidase [Acidiferrobacteraceae bacterium]